ncbi:glycosyltransferase family 2 protein [Oceanihabitans sp. 2_MG-2023]|uniref:glycosyltransferase family 2 protein n=1 Tax=Oceanihabitans sp. 2_MG-2023 TaxID=3062661 RepID=UPI0026E123E1|nr:glycosyltransferase family 2 protein [Oceanihabitans sp. 2_MG-2023]MDO6596826.1 glycosyltransferase family 2 protein [Oceanihabitans sp. 2_MG-2023]
MQEPLISIITPFKNTEAFLTACLDSILNQSYTNWELIIVDDNSTDFSYQLVEHYAKKDTRIKLLKNNGEGIIDALQLAFKNSYGTYITRMDSDDIMHPNKLKIMLYSLLEKGKKHVAIGLVKYFSETGISNGYARYETWINDLTRKGTNYSEIYKECVIPSPCWMLHREDFIAAEAFNPNRYPEDYDLTFRFYKQNYKCIPCNQVLHQWRDYSTRTSRTHEHYAQNYFLDIKLHYFLELDYNTKRPITIWGAGTKGKNIAKALIEKKIPFYWICDNEKKIGKHIYNQELHNFDYLKQIENPQCIVTVANAEAQKEITSYFNTHKMKPMTDYFFFC